MRPNREASALRSSVENYCLWLRTAALVVCLLAGCGQHVAAQPPHVLWLPVNGYPPLPARSTVLVHGGNSSGATWDPFGALLAQNNYGALAPSLTANASIYSQAGTLRSLLGPNGFDTNSPINFVAHSQGGLVSRAASRIQPIRTLITTGTPHQGMPFAQNKWKINFELTMVSLDISDLFLMYYPGPGPEYPDYNYEITDLRYRLWNRGTFGGSLFMFAFSDIYVANSWGAMASWDELAPGSVLLADLNATIGAEQVAAAYSIMNNQGSGYFGGPLRLAGLTGAMADQLGVDMFWVGAELLDLGASMTQALWNTPDPGGAQRFYDFLGAAAALDLGYRLQTIGSWWSLDVVGGEPHDGLIPTASQYRPGSVVVQLNNITHREETNVDVSKYKMLEILNLNSPAP